MFAKICGNVCKESFSLVSLSHLKHGLGFTIFHERFLSLNGS